MAEGIVRELVTLLGFEVDDKALKAAESEFDGLTSLAKSVVKTVAAVTGAMAALALETADYGDDLATTARTLRTTTKGLQEWQYVASTVRVDNEALRGTLSSLAKAQQEIAMRNADVIFTFGRIGVSTRDASGKLKTTDQLLEDVGRGLMRIKDPALRAALGTKVLGDTWYRLEPLFAKGRWAIADLKDEAHALGAVLGEEAIADAEIFTDELVRTTTSIKGLARSVGAELLPEGRKLLGWIREAIRDNRELIRHDVREVFGGIVWGVKLGATFVRRFLSPLGALLKHQKAVEVTAKAAGAALGFVFVVKMGRALMAASALAKGLATTVKAGGGLLAVFKRLALGPVLVAAKWIALGAIIAYVYDDVRVFLNGGRSLLGRFLKEWTKPVNPNDSWPVKLIKTTVGWITKLAEKIGELAGILKDEPPPDPDDSYAVQKHRTRVGKIQRSQRNPNLPNSPDFITPSYTERNGVRTPRAGVSPREQVLGGTRLADMALSGPDEPRIVAPTVIPIGPRAPVRMPEIKVSVGDVNVSVDASGQTNPAAIGGQTARQTRAAVADAVQGVVQGEVERAFRGVEGGQLR